MEIVIDERIELITVVQTLCNYWEELSVNFNCPLCQGKYRENVEKFFRKYKEHKIIKLYNILCNDINDISAFLSMALCYSNPPEMNTMADYEKNWGKINSTVFPYKEFIYELRQFYIDTEFKHFYENNQNEYQNILNSYGDKTELSVNIAIDYYGGNIRDYKIILSALLFGNFGIKVVTNNNEIKNYSIISPFGHKDNNYLFGSIETKKGFIWHEIGHLVINDLTSNFIMQFDLEKRQIPEIFVNNFYNNIETIINEYIIRAVTIRLFEMNGENEIAEKIMKNDMQKGFKNIIYVKDYIKCNYENNKIFVKENRYKELMEYIIDLI